MSTDVSTLDDTARTDGPISVLAYGMSPGDDKVHAVDDIPLDAAVYMAHAAQLRRELGAHGMLYLDDQHDRWDKRDGRDQEVRLRTDRIRILAGRVDPGIQVVTHSDIVAAGHEEELSGRDQNAVMAMYANKKEGRYNVYQTQVVAGWVRWLRAQMTAKGQALDTVIKMGWVAEREYHWQDDETVYSGGEHEHDKGLQALPGLPVKPLYVPPGYMLKRGMRYEPKAGANRSYPAGIAVPYLYQRQGADRLLLRRDLSPDAELLKIEPGIVKATLLAARVFSRAVLGEGLNGELHHLREHAWSERDQEERDPAVLSESRDHLEQALREVRALLS